MPTPRRPLTHAFLRLALSFGLAAALVGLFPPAPVHAQTITVTTTAESPGGSGDCTLGEAIQAANTNAPVDACAFGTSSDTIVLAAGATYTLTSSTINTYGPSAFAITSIVTVQGNGATLALDPVGSPLRFFYISGLGHLTLSNLTLRGGRVRGADGAAGTAVDDYGDNGGTAEGGAIYQAAALTLDGVVFLDNAAHAGRGGDGFVQGLSGTPAGSGGWASGGAVFSTRPLTITTNGASFIANGAYGGNGGDAKALLTQAGSGGDARGGALYFAGVPKLAAAHLLAEGNVAEAGRGGNGLNGVTYGGNGGSAYGGAVYATQFTHLDLHSSWFNDNHATGGDSAATSAYGLPTGGSGLGGALFSSGVVTLTDSSLSSNLARGGSGLGGGDANGGSIHLYPGQEASLTVRASELLSNTAVGGKGSAPNQPAGAARGGALYLDTVSVHLDRSLLMSNHALHGTNPNTVTASSSSGGGLFNASSGSFVTNTTFVGNGANYGGAVFNGALTWDRDALVLTHVTFYSNISSEGGGIYNEEDLWLRNSVVAHNAGLNCAGPGLIALQGENIQFPNGGCATATLIDPLLGTLADHGGDTLTVDLLEKSPAINLADPAYCPATDQRGVARPSGAACDLGAFEYTPIEILILLWLPLVLR